MQNHALQPFEHLPVQGYGANTILAGWTDKQTFQTTASTVAFDRELGNVEDGD